MPYRAVEIANEFLKLPGAANRLTQMQLQKLVYLAHGWNTAINWESLVSDPVEAWDYGPVYRDLYDHAKFFGREPIARQITPDDSEAARFFGDGKRKAAPYSAALSPRERSVIQHVWSRYGSLPASRLVQLTHTPDTPWYETYFNQGKSRVIDQRLIENHYKTLAARVVPKQ